MKTPADLVGVPLLLRLGDPAHPNWEDWFKKAGVGDVSPSEGTRFPDSNMALQAAKEGLGVALARTAHVSDDLTAGNLVRLFDVDHRSSVSYYLVCPEAMSEKPRIVAFRDWLLAEAKIAQDEYDKTASVRLTSPGIG